VRDSSQQAGTRVPKRRVSSSSRSCLSLQGHLGPPKSGQLSTSLNQGHLQPPEGEATAHLTWTLHHRGSGRGVWLHLCIEVGCLSSLSPSVLTTFTSLSSVSPHLGSAVGSSAAEAAVPKPVPRAGELWVVACRMACGTSGAGHTVQSVLF
jgi:hypothetical protein